MSKFLEYLREQEELGSLQKAKSLIPEIIKAAQKEYDDWDEDNIDEYAGGGICHFIADEICSIFNKGGIECSTVSSSYEVHVYCVIKVKEGVYSVDIPYSLYERGGGYSWKKIANVKFDSSYVDFYLLSENPEEFENFVEDY